jgi:hypothetical protein
VDDGKALAAFAIYRIAGGKEHLDRSASADHVVGLKMWRYGEPDLQIFRPGVANPRHAGQRAHNPLGNFGATKAWRQLSIFLGVD